MAKDVVEKLPSEVVDFIRGYTEDGCPPSGDCENYKVDEESLSVDCEMCLHNELAKLLKRLGYHQLPEGKPPMLSDEAILQAFDGDFGEVYFDHKPTPDEILLIKLKLVVKAQYNSLMEKLNLDWRV